MAIGRWMSETANAGMQTVRRWCGAIAAACGPIGPGDGDVRSHANSVGFRFEPLEPRILLSAITLGSVGFNVTSSSDTNINVDLGNLLNGTDTVGASESFTGSLSVLKQSIGGTFIVSETAAAGSSTPVTFGVSGSNISLNLGDGTNTLVSLTGGSGNFYLNNAGIAGHASGAVALENVPHVTAGGSNFYLDINTFSGAVNTTVNGQSLSEPVGSFLSLGGTGVYLTALGQQINGNFTFMAQTISGQTSVAVTANTVQASFGDGTTNYVNFSGGSGAFDLTSAGVASTLTGTVALENLPSGISLTPATGTTFGLDVNTTGAGPFVEIQANGVDLQVAGQALTGNFDFQSQTANGSTTVTAAATDVGLSLGDGTTNFVTFSGGSGAMVISSAGLAATLTTTVSLTNLPSTISLTPAAGTILSLDINTTGQAVDVPVTFVGGSVTVNEPAGPFVQIEANDVQLNVEGQSISGNFAFQAQTASGATTVYLAATNVGMQLGNGTTTFVQLTKGSGFFILSSGGVAGTASATISLENLPSNIVLTPVTGTTFSLAINTTGAAVTNTFTLGGQNVTLNVPGGPFVRVEADNVDLAIAGQTLSGNFAFQEQGSGSSAVVTVSASNVGASFGDGVTNYLALTKGSGAFILETGGIAGTATANVALENVSGVAATNGTFTLDVNTISQSIAQQVTIGGQTISLNLPAGPFVEIDGTGLTIQIGDVSLTGNFIFQDQTNNGQQQVVVGAAGVTGFFGVGSGTADATGLSISKGQGGLIIQKGGVALDVTVTATLEGINNLNLSSTMDVQVDTLGAVSQTVGVPLADGTTQNVVLNFTGNTVVVAGAVELTVGTFTTLSGQFSFAETSSTTAGVTTSEFDVGATGVTAFFGTGANTSAALGLSITKADLGLVILKTIDSTTPANSTAATYALVANGTGALVGLGGLNLTATLGVRINTTGTALDKTINTLDGNSVALDFTATGTAAVEEIDATNVQFQILDSNGYPIVSISGAASITDSAGTLTVTISSLTFAVYINDKPIVSLTGSVAFTLGGSAGFALVPGSFQITGFSLMNSGSGAGPNLVSGSQNVAGSNTPTSTASNITTVTSHSETASGGNATLGPLALTGVKPTLSNFSFSNGALSMDIGLTAASAALNFGGSSGSGPVSATLTGVSGDFNLGVTVDPSTFRVTSISSTGQFSLSIQSFLLTVQNVLTATATGVAVQYNPQADNTQKILTINSASITLTNYSLTGSIGPTVVNNVTVPGLVVYGDGFALGTATITDTSTIKIGSVVSLTGFYATISNLSATYGTAFVFNGSIGLGAASASIGTGGFVFSGTNVSATLQFANNVPSGFLFTAGSLSLQISKYLTLSGTNITIDPTAGQGTDTNANIATFSSLSATLSISSSLVITGTAQSASNQLFDITSAGAFVPPNDFLVALSFSGLNGGQFAWPSFIPIQITTLELLWTNFNTDPTNFIIDLSANVSGNFGPIALTGNIQNVKIDVGLLAQGLFPIISIESVSVGASGNMFGGVLSANLTAGIVGVDAAGAIIPPNSNETPTKRIFYAGIDGGFKVANLGFQIQFGISSEGLLEVYFGASAPIVLDPNSGLELASFFGGVSFNATPFPIINQPTDLRSPIFTPALQLTTAQWEQQLQQQTANQAGNGTGFLFQITTASDVTNSLGAATPFISTALYNDFLNVGFSMATTATITNLGGNNWLLNDSGNVYVVQTAGAAFNVSRILFNLSATQFATELGTEASANTAVGSDIVSAFAAQQIVLNTSDTVTAVAGTTDEWLINDPAGNFILQEVGSGSTAALVAYGHGGSMSMLTSIIQIEAGATISDEYTSPNFLSGSVSIILQTDGKFVLDGSLTIGGKETFDAKMYADLSKVQTGAGQIVFLADLPQNPAILSLQGNITFQFFNGSQSVTPTAGYTPPTTAPATSFEINISGAVVLTAPANVETITVQGMVNMTFSSSQFQLTFNASASASGSIINAQGVIQAAGQFTVDYSNGFQAWGVAELAVTSKQIAPLNSAGITFQANTVIEFNFSNSAQTVNLTLPNFASGTKSTLPATFVLPVGPVYFNVSLWGIAQFQQGPITATLAGAFSLQVTSNSSGTTVDMFIVATLDVGQPTSPVISFDAVGLIIVNSSGFAGMLDLQTSRSLPFNALTFSAQFQLYINSTGATQSYTLPQELAAALPTLLPADLQGLLVGGQAVSVPGTAPQLTNDSTVETPGPYVVIMGKGTVSALNQFAVNGAFRIDINSSGFDIAFAATVDLSSLGTLNASGDLVVNSLGAYGGLLLTGNIAVGPLSFSGGLTLEFNTTGESQTIQQYTIDATGAVSSTGVSVNANTVQLVVDGTLSFAGAFDLQGTFDFTESPGLISVTVDASLGFFGLSLNVSGAANIYTDGPNPGMVLYIDVGTQSFGIQNIFTISGDLIVEVNTRGVASDVVAGGTLYSIPNDTYEVAAQNITVSLLSVITLNGSASAVYSNGVFRMSASLSANFFNIASMSVSGWFQSDGQFYVNFQGNLNIGADGFGVFGSASVTISYENDASGTPQLNLYGNASLQGELFGVNIGSINVNFGYSSSTGQISVGISVTINFFFFSITIGGQYVVGYLMTPPPVQPATLIGSDLYLNVGARAQYRNYNTGNTNESAVITGANFNPSTGTEDITVALLGTSKTYNGVTAIYADGGGGSDYYEIDQNVLVPAYVTVGDGPLGTNGGSEINDKSSAGGTLIAGSGSDVIQGGSGAKVITAGAGGQYVINGGGNDDNITISPDGNTSSAYNITEAAGTGSNTLTINGPTGYAPIVLSRGGNFANDTTNGQAMIGDNSNNAADTVNFSGLQQLTVNDSASSGVASIAATVSPTIINNISGVTQFYVVGSNAPFGGGIVDNISSPLTINGGGSDRLTVDDSGSTVAKTGSLTASTITGLNTAGITYGGISNLSISLGSGGNTFTVSGTGTGTVLNDGLGADTINVQATNNALTINTQGGGDVVTIGDNLGQVVSGVTVNGALDDTLVISNANGSIQSGTLTGSVLTGLGLGVGITYNRLGYVNVDLGPEHNLFVVDQTAANTQTLLDSTSGQDSINVLATTGPLTVDTAAGSNGNTNLIDIGSVPQPASGVVGNVQGAVTINGSGGDTLLVNDMGDATNRVGGLTAGAVTGLGMGADGIAYSGITQLTIYLGSGVNDFTIAGDSGAHTLLQSRSGQDTVNVQAVAGPTTLNFAAGLNIINIGSSAPNTGGVLGGVQSLLTINGGGVDLLTVDDTGDATGRVGTLTGSSITGLGMTGRIAYAGIGTLNINLGSGGNVFNVLSTNSGTATNLASGVGSDTVNVQGDSGPLSINTQGGVNTVNIGSNAPAGNGTLYQVTGPIVVSGNGADTMNVDDTGATAAQTGTLTAATLTGLGMVGGGITYRGLAELNISLGAGGNTFLIASTSGQTATTLNSGAGNDTVNVQTTADPLTTINTQGGVNTINIGSVAPTLGGIVDGIQGGIVVNGNGADTLNVDDTGSSGAKSGVLTANTLDGLAMGTAGITYAGINNLNISLGSGGNIMLIASTNAATSTVLNSGAGNDTVNVETNAGPLTINTQSGVNVVNVGSLAPALGGIVDGVQGALTINGSGADTLNVDDTGSLGAKIGALTASQILGLNMGPDGITYSGLAYLNISLGSGGNGFNVVNTAATTDSTLNSGLGSDTVNILATTGLLNVNTQTGTDTVNLQSNVGTVSINTGTGLDTVNVGSIAPLQGGVLAGIQGAVNVQGGFHTTMNVDDTGDAVGQTGTLTPTTLTGLTMGQGITYSGLSNLNISLGSGGNTFFIHDIDPATVTAVAGGASNHDTIDATFAADFNGLLNLTQFEHGAIQVAANFNGTLNDTLPGNLETVAIGGSITPLGTLLAGNISTGMTVGGDVAGTVLVQNTLANMSVGGDVSGSITESGTINLFTIGGSLTSTGVIKAVNATPDLGNINTLTIQHDLAGTVIVSGTLGTLNIINGSITPTASLTLGNLNTLNIGPDYLVVGDNMAGQLTVLNTLGAVRVAGGTPGTFTVGQIGTISAFGGFGPVALQVIENGIQRRVEIATPALPYPMPNANTVALPPGQSGYVNLQFMYESGSLANPQLTARITNGASTAAYQYDLSLVVYNDVAKFNLARLDAVGVSGVRNVAVEGDLLTSVSAAALSFFLNSNGSTDNTLAGVRLPLDNLVGVAIRDFAPNGYIQAATIQGVAFGSYAEENGQVFTGSQSNAEDAQDLLTWSTRIVQANNTFRVPFADLPTQQVALFMAMEPWARGFDNSGILFEVQSLLTPNATDTANIVTPSNVARGAVTALVTVAATYDWHGHPQDSLITGIALRGDGAAIYTSQWIDGPIFGTGPLGDLYLLSNQGIADITAPAIFGSIISGGPIYGTIQTTGVRMDPITNAVTNIPATFGNVFVVPADDAYDVPYLAATVIEAGALPGEIVSRGNLLSAMEFNGGITGTIAAQGNLGAAYTVAGTDVRLGGLAANGGFSGNMVVLGQIIGDITINGGLRDGRIAAQGGILGNVQINGGIDDEGALISGGGIGNAAWGTGLILNGDNQGIIAADGVILFPDVENGPGRGNNQQGFDAQPGDNGPGFGDGPEFDNYPGFNNGIGFGDYSGPDGGPNQDHGGPDQNFGFGEGPGFGFGGGPENNPGSDNGGPSFQDAGPNQPDEPGHGSDNPGREQGYIFNDVGATAGSASAAAINAIFTSSGQPLAFDINPLDLQGLTQLEANLNALYVNDAGVLV